MKVWLKPFEDEPRQEAEILSIDQMSWGISVACRVEPDPEYPSDDGIREVNDLEQFENQDEIMANIGYDIGYLKDPNNE